MLTSLILREYSTVLRRFQRVEIHVERVEMMR